MGRTNEGVAHMNDSLTDYNPLRTLHIAIGTACNNNCIFCCEGDREGRAARQVFVTDENVRSILAANIGLGKVVFTSGEPTLNPKLPEYITLARQIGYHSVSIVTNGRMLFYRDLAERITGAGVTEIVISLHSLRPELHDRLTRSPGGFIQAFAGFSNLCALRSKYHFELHVSRVVCRPNIDGLATDCHQLSAFPINTIILNPLMPIGRADNSRLLVPYTEIVSAIKPIPAEVLSKISLNDTPLCTAMPILSNIGTMEIYSIKDDRSANYSQPVLEGREKRDQCSRCRFDPVCTGVWSRYIEFFGWDEFNPAEK